MTPMIKWIGGAMAAIVLVLGGATLAGDFIGNNASQSVASQPPEAALAQASMIDAIPVDEDMIAKEDAGTGAAIDGAESPAEAGLTTASVQEGASPGSASIQRISVNKPKAKSEKFVVKRILDIDGPMKYGEWHWDTEGVPDGPLVITVDLKARVMSVFRGGYEIGAAVAMLGTKEHPTPTGTFPILRKQRHNVSEKYNNAPMPWSMFLTRDGIAIHGGSAVENGYASHGCIAIPDELASRVFKLAKRGDKVIITNGETMSLGDTII